MYNKQLETFLQVAHHRSFSKAAETLFISPSAVIQQMNNLEKHLQTTLFIRTKQGVSLTEAGVYLAEEAASYIEKGNAILNHLHSLTSDSTVIVIGTSITLKIRLLYELWMLFSDFHKGYTIKLVSADIENGLAKDIALMECLYPDMENQKGWEFLKICDVPLSCAVPKNHALAAHNQLHYEDIRPYTVMIMQYGCGSSRAPLVKHMKEHGIKTQEAGCYSSSVIWECACNQNLLLVPLCWQDILFDSVVIPCEWELTLPYGLWYREHPAEPVREFLDFVHETYYGDTPLGVVPVF